MPTLAVNTREIITDLTVIPTYTVPQVQVSEKGSGEQISVQVFKYVFKSLI